MNRQLFVCNSVYQVLVALWIKYIYYPGELSDIIISDHMNGAKTLAENIKDLGVFDEVYYVESSAFAKHKIAFDRKQRIIMSMCPNYTLKNFIKLSEKYTELYAANVDYFSQLLFDALTHRYSKLKFIIYEDGLFTYSRLYEEDYKSTYIPVKSLIKKMIHSVIYRKKTIYGNVTKLMVFNPENMVWKPEFHVEQLKKIDCHDDIFRKICNQVFSYDKSTDVYDRKYIFLEESFFAEGAKIDDLEVIEKLAKLVGRDEIMVKIHPRNPYNRFSELGYKTNKDTSIPWELVLMNVDMSDKVLITISSSSILNPILVLGQKVKAYSIYECVDHEHCHSRLLSGEMWEIAYRLFMKYSDMITICHSVDEIK